MIRTDKHLAYTLGSTVRMLDEITSNIGKYYYYKEEPKTKYGIYQHEKNGAIKYRKLYPSVYPLKKIQQNIHSFLQEIELPEYAYGSVVGKSNVLNAAKHIGNKYFLTVDLKNFFSYISHHQVFKMFRERRFSHSVSRTLTKLT